MNMDNDADVNRQAADQSRFSPPRPISRRVHVNHVGTKLRVAAPSLEFTPRPPIGPPFRPQSARRVRCEQFGFPTFGRMVGQRAHDGRHATRRIAWTDVQHLAHGHRTPFAIKKGSANRRPYVLLLRRT